MRSCARRTFGIAARTFEVLVTMAAVCLALAATATVSAQSNAENLFKEAQSRETALRHEIDTRKAGSAATPLLERARTLVGAYDDMAKLFPRSPFSDNALWQGATLAADAFWEFGQAADRLTALRMLKALTARYPGSSLVKQVAAQSDRLSAAKPAGEQQPTVTPAATPASTATTTPAVAIAPSPTRPVATAPNPTRMVATAPNPAPTVATAPTQPTVMLTAIRREVLAGALRITIELEGEAAYHDEQIDGPPRVFIDLQNARPVEALRDATQTFPDDVVRQIRVGRQVGTRTRVVLDLTGTPPHTTYALYSPYRIVIDFAREASPMQLAQLAKPMRPEPSAPPQPNASGGFSLSRQLGLGVARVVIDPGHGGHDPGAMNNGLSEAELVLDVAMRLEKLLLNQPGVEVVMTRRSNVYVPLEERTALANREEADLFLSIHANASEDDRVRGIETYFLNFAPNPAAEVVAARENAASARTMRQLPDIVKAIALNNKIDESRDFASLVQSSMMDRLKRSNKGAKDLGVKQAPFMVLIGATMPSILAEVSFLTNRQEAALLRSSAYRQQIAAALFNGVMRYQKSLKVAAQTFASQ
jgi:N-acetylmuramoyl-L-alanine amidase